MRICYRAAHCACKGILPRFLALAHSCVDTERLFSHERVFRAICDISSGFATTPSCLVRANAHYARVRICVRRGAPDHVGAIAFALKKCAEPFSYKAKKRDRPLYFVKKGAPMSFSAARRFVGTAFCRCREIRHLFAYFIDSSGYRSVRAVANGRICRYFGLCCAHRLLSLSMIVFRKIRALFAL